MKSGVETMMNTALPEPGLPVSGLPVSGEASQQRRVRELARDAMTLMAFSIGVSVALMCTIVAIASLVG